MENTPLPHVVRNADVEDTQAKLAARYRLSRQTAHFMALLVYFPTVTQKTVDERIGSVDSRNIVRRLRTRLRKSDEDALIITTLHGFGYCFHDVIRRRLLDDTGDLWEKPQEDRPCV